MTQRRLHPRLTAVSLLSIAAALLLALGIASPAQAAAVPKLTVLASWTQPNATSSGAWNAARTNQAPWQDYRFDWSTDYCSASPDQPLGFDFRLSCWHHDFGYRNYKAVGQFNANKPRVDDTFYYDLKTKCSTYSVVVRPACYSLAWTYYEAVSLFGSLRVAQADLDRAAALKAQGEAAAAEAAASKSAA